MYIHVHYYIKLFKVSVRHAQEGVVAGIVYSEVAR